MSKKEKNLKASIKAFCESGYGKGINPLPSIRAFLGYRVVFYYDSMDSRLMAKYGDCSEPTIFVLLEWFEGEPFVDVYFAGKRQPSKVSKFKNTLELKSFMDKGVIEDIISSIEW